jgi:hypothetical protein
VHNAKRLFPGRICPLWLLFAGLIQAVQLSESVYAQPFEPAPKKEVAQKIDFVTGREFRLALQNQITIAWQDEHLRSGLAQLTAARKVAIILDRRIDPDQMVSLQIRNIPLADLLAALAESAGAHLSVLENFVYIGPEATAKKLRTLVDIRTRELLDGGPALAKRRFELFNRRAIEWNDLDRPSEILKLAADRFGVRINGAEKISHDLWAATVLPGSTAIEVLSVVLAQFDLTFEWEANATSVRLVTMPQNPLLERTWDVKSRTIRTLAAGVPRMFPRTKVELKGSRLIAQGSSEQLEQINDVLYPKRDRPPNRVRGPKKLSFTFHLRGTVGALMPGLEKQSDLRFDYDQQAIAKAGIDLNHQVDVKMQNADIEELCHALFDKAKLAFEINGTNVKVYPKP